MLIRTADNGYRNIGLTVVWIALAAVLIFCGLLGISHVQNTSVREIRRAIETGEKTVRVNRSPLSADELCGIYCSDPAMFHVEGIGYTYDGKQSTYTIRYRSYAADYARCFEEYRSLLSEVTERIRSRVGEGDGERELLRLIHDEIVNGYSYDESYTVRDAYTMLKTGKGVCSAYTQLFIALCGEFGIECRYLRSVPMDHAWNLVKVDGKFLHVDCTWDDPIGGSPNDTYFLLTDEEMSEKGHRGWVDTTECVELHGGLIQKMLFVSLGLLALSVIVCVVRILLAKRRGGNGITRCAGKCSDEELLLAMSKVYALNGGGSVGTDPDKGTSDGRDGA